ncbi:DUF402 domain-containing protein [Lederbergia wuyishanensis]|uniref:RNA-binding protein associated with RNAse of E/G family n=1 Tax=Lederbergia wuyishanensis TaxID=1347903 RepID=A0ABU0D3M9_9BACI|nr:DUF402 domain-containing protein [Lederbergia wuyishanensis]MCJ8007818.1 DUF402 domain-containing protein [Lederbergia wuyishanensis]MDQ0343015.1 putative RNA-binding protein associated with RNAse of E/G family [Lederbergia wuyishanensis]
MLERKYGDRSEWKRVLKREYIQSFFDTEEFKGYVTLLNIHNVREPLFVKYGANSVCIVDDGYIWLQHFPTEGHHSLTTMFDAQGNIVQWYVDICLQCGIDNNVPWVDDLFLDIVILPTGEIFIKDEDELDEALSRGSIDEKQYKIAWKEANKLCKLIANDGFDLMKLSRAHKEMLLKKLNK